jgi:hypothetical protein
VSIHVIRRGDGKPRAGDKPRSARLCLEKERPDRFDASETLRQEAGCLAHQDRPRGGRLLQSRGNIGGIPDDRMVHRQFVADRAKDHGAAVDTDAHGQIQLVVGTRLVVAERLANGDGGQQSPPYMILLRQRSAEKGEKPVTSELRRRTAIAMHLGEARLQKRADEVTHRLGSEALGQRRRVHDVAEQHADLLHLAGQQTCRACDRRRLRPRCVELGRPGNLQCAPVKQCSALAAEPVFSRIGRAA